MLNEKRSPVRHTGGYYGNRVIIEGTKTLKGRGWYYDYVVIFPSGDVEVGSEEGNYAGGIWLSPYSEDYRVRLGNYLERIENQDKQFYDLIKAELLKMEVVS